MLRSITSLLFGLLLFSSFSQSGILGQTQTREASLPFATVYVKGTTTGTVSNTDGNYVLKLSPGRYTIVAQYVGYQAIEKEVSITSGKLTKLDFILEEQALKLQTVVVTADDEDPAYRIIREAIKKRKFYEKEVNAFKCDAYLKGLQRLDDRPDKIFGVKITIDTGIVYLSESVSEFAFEQPDSYSEKMISSKISGDDQGFSFNQASDFHFNIYQRNFDFDGLVERMLISPISNQAFLFYDFEWLGSFEENEKTIHKVKLLPKRDSDPVFDGVIYIVEGSWRLHTIDLLLVKSRGIEFLDSLKINQTLAPVEDNIWMPISQRFSFTFKAFGFKGSGYFVGVYANYEVEPNYQLYKESQDTLFDAVPIKDLFNEDDFTQEVFSIEDGSNEKDSVYWERIRPIPLTGIEIEDYRVKDSIRIVKESIPYKDSVDAETNKLTLGNVLLSGYTRSNSVEEKYWTIPSLLSIAQFNTVEGAVLNMEPTYWKDEKDRTKYWIRPSFRYGFSSEKFYSKIEASYRKLDDRFTRFYFGAGQYVAQFDESEPISYLINSWTTLNGNNYMKLYQKSFGFFRFQQEVKNGIRFTGELEYAVRDTLSNTKLNYYWVPTREVAFTSNIPVNEELNNQTGFDTNNAFFLKLNFRIRFDQKYASRPDGRVLYPSKYPELNVNYKKGIKSLGSDVNFDFIKLTVSDDFSLGLIGTSNYVVSAGSFLNKQSLIFVDYIHFQGNETNLSSINTIERFQLLPYYQFSTTSNFLNAHYEHHFNEFIFNKIPIVRKLNLQSVISTNYLKSEPIGDYFEFGIGIEHIFKFLRVDYWWALRNGDSFGNGFTFGVGF